MLKRFCLYGFLKNQTYWAPFIFLCFLEKGLSFTQIGLLLAIREVAINLLEIPSGALADLFGRRKAMIVSFTAYIFSFSLLGCVTNYFTLIFAMALLGVGDAFRTGTHKAMIMTWLERENRLDEKTKIYGLTRSWSRIGSATSALIAAALVFRSGNYASIFWWSIFPYFLGLINFAGYPSYLDGTPKQTDASAPPTLKLISFLTKTTRQVTKRGSLRRILTETMLADGLYGATKDYLQAAIKVAAISLPLALSWSSQQRGAVLVGLIYFVFHLLESAASRNAHLVVSKCGNETLAAKRIWQLRGLLYLALLLAFALGGPWTAILAFVALGILQNVWRPLQVSRVQSHADAKHQATVLSMESQAKSIATMVLAPLVGVIVDTCATCAAGASSFLLF